MCVPDQTALGESVRSDAGDAQRACVTATDAPAPPVAVARMLGRRLPRVLLVHGSRHARLVALASRAVLRGFGVGSTVSQADDASLAPRERGTATLKTAGGSGGGGSQGELEPERCTPAWIAWRSTPSTRPPNDTGTAPAAASRRDSRSNSASERAAASTRACDASATAAACARARRRLARRLAPPRGGRPRGPYFVDDREPPPAVRVHARRDAVVCGVFPRAAMARAGGTGAWPARTSDFGNRCRAPGRARGRLRGRASPAGLVDLAPATMGAPPRPPRAARIYPESSVRIHQSSPRVRTRHTRPERPPWHRRPRERHDEGTEGPTSRRATGCFWCAVDAKTTTSEPRTDRRTFPPGRRSRTTRKPKEERKDKCAPCRPRC